MKPEWFSANGSDSVRSRPTSTQRLTAFATLLLAIGLTACATSQQDLRQVARQPGVMPPGGDWQGVYTDARYGRRRSGPFRPTRDGKLAVRHRQRRRRSHRGNRGQRAAFPLAGSSVRAWQSGLPHGGSGFFVYVVPRAGAKHELRGEWRPNAMGSADPWRALKTANRSNRSHRSDQRHPRAR